MGKLNGRLHIYTVLICISRLLTILNQKSTSTYISAIHVSLGIYNKATKTIDIFLGMNA